MLTDRLCCVVLCPIAGSWMQQVRSGRYKLGLGRAHSRPDSNYRSQQPGSQRHCRRRARGAHPARISPHRLGSMERPASTRPDLQAATSGARDPQRWPRQPQPTRLPRRSSPERHRELGRHSRGSDSCFYELQLWAAVGALQACEAASAGSLPELDVEPRPFVFGKCHGTSGSADDGEC